MQWFIYTVKDNYFNFYGRARRTEYWMFYLVNMVIGLIFGLLTTLISPYIYIAYLLYSLAVFLPALALSVRRMHDLNKSWVWILITLIPLIGPIWFLILTLTPGTYGDNQFGPDPKANDYINR